MINENQKVLIRVSEPFIFYGRDKFFHHFPNYQAEVESPFFLH
jgi:hypothetical protein